jgi:2-keto-4-pentenoate hydratase
VKAAAALAAALACALPARAACPDTAEVARFAQALLERRVPAPFAELTEQDARCAQDRLVATLSQPWGDVEGAALAADALPALRGALFHATLRAVSGAVIEARYAARPAIAPALLLRIGREGIAAAGADALSHVDAVMPFLALLDLAAMPSGLDATARLAGNLGVRLGVRGAPTGSVGATALAGVATLQADGSVVASLPALGLAAPVADLLRDLAAALAAEGRPLRVGAHVALLGPAAPFAPRPGESWRLSIAGIGAVAVEFR